MSIYDLPVELLVEIFLLLDRVSLLSVSASCQHFKNVLEVPNKPPELDIPMFRDKWPPKEKPAGSGRKALPQVKKGPYAGGHKSLSQVRLHPFLLRHFEHRDGYCKQKCSNNAKKATCTRTDLALVKIFNNLDEIRDFGDVLCDICEQAKEQRLLFKENITSPTLPVINVVFGYKGTTVNWALFAHASRLLQIGDTIGEIALVFDLFWSRVVMAQPRPTSGLEGNRALEFKAGRAKLFKCLGIDHNMSAEWFRDKFSKANDGETFQRRF